MALGWIYVLSNEAMPGLVKIGQSAADPEFRAAELHTTGVPRPFRIEYKGLFEDFISLERAVHFALSDRREHHSREFFRTSVQIAVEKIREAAQSPVCFEVWSGPKLASETSKRDLDGIGAAEESWVQMERQRRRQNRESGAVDDFLHINCAACGAVVRNSQVQCDRCGRATQPR